MSFNCSLSPGTKQINEKIDQLAQIVIESGADVVGLQEASDVNPSDVEELNQLLSYQINKEHILKQFQYSKAVQLICKLVEYPYALVSQVQSQGVNINYGLIVVSRFPIVCLKPPQHLDQTSQNGLLNTYISCLINHPSYIFNFYNTQLSDNKNRNIIQNHQLSNAIKSDDNLNPSILSISLFNTGSDILEDVMQDSSKIQRFANFNTFPSWSRIQRQDRIYYRGLNTPANTEVIELAGTHSKATSNHCPIVTDFILNW